MEDASEPIGIVLKIAEHFGKGDRPVLEFVVVFHRHAEHFRGDDGGQRFGEIGQEVQPAHFHHVLINSVDPAASIQFYGRVFGATPIKFRGVSDAAFTEKSFILFNKVDQPAESKLNTGIWHIGWGGVDVKNEYEWWKKHKVTIHTPLSPLPGPDNFYMYISGPDKELIEINTMGHHRFAHVHFFCTDVNESVAWYVKHLGIKQRRLTVPKPQGDMSTLAGIWINVIQCDNVTMIFFGKPDVSPAPPLVARRAVERNPTHQGPPDRPHRFFLSRHRSRLRADESGRSKNRRADHRAQ